MANKVSLTKGILKLALPMLALLAIGVKWHSVPAGAAQAREVRVVNTSGVSGQSVNVSVELVAQGNENALGFSLNFNPAVFSTPSVSPGTGAVGATLNVNLSQAGSGRIGIAMAMSTGQTFAAGTRQIVTIGFAISGNAGAGATSITFGDQPIAREVSDANANVLTTTFTQGTITIQQPNPVPALTSLNPASATAGSSGFALTVNGSNFVPLSTVRWNGVTRTTQFVSSTQLTATIPASDLTAAGTASVDVVSPAPGGGTSNSLNFTINNPAPAITSLSPSSAAAGGAAFTLTINGTGFVSTSTVWWNGAQRTTQFVSATQLTASITAGDIATAGTASVVVNNPSPGGGSSPAATFTINNPAPTITSLSPNSATAGGAAFTLTINGTGFVSTSTVWWNGDQRVTQFVSATQLTASITAGDIATAGTASVVVNNPSPGGGSSSAATFSINNPGPAITSLSPNSATAGGSAFTLTINGTGFVSTSTVWWNGAQRTTQFVSATQLTASIPASDIAAAGTASVVVNNPVPGGGSSPAATFTINNPAPTITSLSPNSATAGGAAFTLTVNGSNFVSTSTVWWNGAQRTTQFVSATQLTASIPASDIAAAGTASVVVNSPAPGGGSSPAATFTINNPVPAVTSLSPNSATAGGSAFMLTVNGNNFVSTSTVWWNGTQRTTQFVSATQLTASIPASDIATAGTANVVIQNPAPGGGSSPAATFTISQTPTAQIVIDPATPTTNDDITIRLSGNWPDACVPQNPQLTVNGNELRIDTTNPSQVCATVVTLWNLNVPAGKRAAGNYTVRVVHTANSIARELGTRAFTVNHPVPAITNLNPGSATAGGAAFTLTVNGSNFVSTSTVWWNGAQRTTQFVSPTQLTASITAADIATAGTASVVVNSPSPGGGSSPGATFTINQAALTPATTSINPNVGMAGGAAFVLTVNGTNFTNTSIVNWNGSPRTTQFVSATQLTAAILVTDIATAGTASVTVVTPAPGGGTSNPQTFTIISPVASVSAASFLGAELAAESIVAAFGVNLATSVAIADATPLPTILAGTKVSVKDNTGTERLAPLFFVAPGQVNYQMPQGMANGAATITITSGDGKISIGTQQITTVAPGLFSANSNGQGVPAANVFRLKANGEQSTELLSRFDATLSRFVPIPIDLGPEGEQVFGIFYGTGFRNNGSLANVTAKIGGVTCEVLYAGITPGFIGLDQFNIRLERSLIGRGEVDVVITVNGKIANTVRINIK